MALVLEIRNPEDLTGTYTHIEIDRGLLSTGADMALIATPAINTATASDLSSGYTTYNDTGGTEGTHYYRFRYKVGSTYSSYSEIYLAGTTIFHTKFRNRMRDTNSNNYYFSNSYITDMLSNAVNKLFPRTFQEYIDETLTTLANTRKYNFPTGIYRVTDIEFLDSSGNVLMQAPDWNVRARQIIFNSVPYTGYTMRLYAEKAFRKIAEVPEVYDDLIIDLMRLEAYETFEADRQQFYKYTTVTSPEGGNMPSIARVVERLRVSTERRLGQVARVRKPVTYSI